MIDEVDYEEMLKSQLVQIVFKIKYKDILNELSDRSIELTDTKVHNAFRNWYWGVGFDAIEVEDNNVYLYVKRPNKFIGDNNFLRSLSSEFYNNGLNLELRKSPPDYFYNQLELFESNM